MNSSNSLRLVEQEENTQEAIHCEECSADCSSGEVTNYEFQMCHETGLCLSCGQKAYDDYAREVRSTYSRYA